MSPEWGTQLGGYRIDGVVGRGGMGVVYRATEVALDSPVALKLISPELAHEEGFRERFLRESRLAAALDHPGILPVYAAGEADGKLYLATRFVDGIDLRELVERAGPLPAERALTLVGQVADALDGAHAQPRPPRRQAGQRARRCLRSLLPVRLRPDQAARGRRDDGNRRPGRLPRLPRSRADPARRGRRAGRHIRARVRALRVPRGRAPVSP